MNDSQNSRGYNYLFGEADEITRGINENRRQHVRNDDTPPEHLSENIYSTVNYYDQPQRQPPLSIHHQFQNQPTIQRPFCFRCLMSMLISWLLSFFVPANRSTPIRRSYPSNVPPPLASERFRDPPSHDSLDEIIQRSVVPERVVPGDGGLTERQISQLPTIKFKPSIEDKKCLICQTDYVRGERMTILPCTHKYHEDCIRPWLKKSKLCCVCKKEVASSY